MRGINVSRLLIAGVVVAALLWLLESAASGLYLNRMQSVLRTRDLIIEPSLMLTIMSVVIALLIGLTLMFLYAAV